MSAVAMARQVRVRPQRLLRTLLPALSLALVLAAIAVLNPRAISYLGFSLMLNLAIPIVLVTVAQMFVICGNDLDLSIGPFVSFSACVSATLLQGTPLLGAAVLAAGVAVYAGLGALIHLRRLPSIIVTLGMSFIWQGLAVLILPQPGGTAPDWLLAIMAIRPPFVPLPILAALGIAAVAYLILMGPSYGAILRGYGGNAAAIRRAGWSLLNAKLVLFTLAGPVRCVVGPEPDRDHHLGGCQYRQRLYAFVHRGRHSGRRRIYRRPGFAGRSRAGLSDAYAGGLAAADFHADSPGLADRRQWRDPDCRSCRAGADWPEGKWRR